MTKKIVLMLVAFMLMFAAGCCKKVDVNGVETTSFSNCLDDVETVLCNPPQVVMDVAQLADPILQMLLKGLAPDSELYDKVVSSISVVSFIQQGLCVTVHQVNNLIAVLGTPEAKMAEVQLAKRSLVMMKAVPAQVNVKVLENWRDGVIK